LFYVIEFSAYYQIQRESGRQVAIPTVGPKALTTSARSSGRTASRPRKEGSFTARIGKATRSPRDASPGTPETSPALSWRARTSVTSASSRLCPCGDRRTSCSAESQDQYYCAYLPFWEPL